MADPIGATGTGRYGNIILGRAGDISVPAAIQRMFSVMGQGRPVDAVSAMYREMGHQNTGRYNPYQTNDLNQGFNHPYVATAQGGYVTGEQGDDVGGVRRNTRGGQRGGHGGQNRQQFQQQQSNQRQTFPAPVLQAQFSQNVGGAGGGKIKAPKKKRQHKVPLNFVRGLSMTHLYARDPAKPTWNKWCAFHHHNETHTTRACNTPGNERAQMLTGLANPSGTGSIEEGMSIRHNWTAPAG